MKQGRQHAVAVGGLRKHYGDVQAVNGIDLLIEPGEVVALLGPNGAGKSTTIDMILGLTRPDTGEVRLLGETPMEAMRRGAVGAMLQETALLDDVTVHETLAMVASLHRTPLPVQEALRRAGVEDLGARRSARLSGGQKQRVRFAMALVSDPELLVLDEPTSAMDVGSRRDFWGSMHVFTETGRTVLFATHYLEEAETYADRVVLLNAGKIAADGPVAAVISAVGGRTIRAVVPGARLDELRGLPGVTGVELRGDRADLRCADSDLVLRELLSRFPAVHDVEVRALGLEEAFLQVTTRDTEVVR
ncbi:ABC transporter ATP-binding protein [Streptosporangium sp. NBC_01639]|uniref:ABC transporter ATP-binding protein n=1 Tax=Streptosporangium sp. NBC_01639 TaxID=2975948 RepID=UPI00386B3FAC|nr:ABC transporter ATP-binding protein [Streptosporangium sp. NBC_01639]